MRILLIVFLLTGISFALDPDASSLYNDIKSNYGSKDSINNNINKPATGTADYKTVDGQTTFSAPLECPSEDKAVVISFSQAGGDWVASIRVDTDLNGTFDYNYTTINISGVCTNGIVSCDNGTWNNCKHYYWDANNRKPVLIQASDTSQTGPCACANVSCGITSLDQSLLSQIGGGISQAIMKTDNRFLITKSKWNGNSLEMYGQDTQNCSTPNGYNYGDNNPTQYYNNQQEPNVSLVDVANEQGTDEYSPYSVVSDIPNLEYENGNQIGMPSIQACTIRNTVYVSQTEYFTDGGCYLGTSNPCTGGSSQISENLYKCSVNPTGGSCGQIYDVSLCGKWETSWSIPDDERVYIKINGTVIKDINRSGDDNEGGSGSCNGDTTQGTASCNSNGYTASSDFVSAYFEYRNNGSCNGTPTSKLYYFYTSKDKLAVSTSDTCPSSCILVNEWVCDKDGNNCIQTVQDGNPLLTNLSSQCFTYTTSLGQYLVCADGNSIYVQDGIRKYNIGSGWFYVKREYNCGTQNLEVDLSRTKSVVEKTTKDPNSQTINYTDTDGTTDSAEFDLDSNTCLNPVCTVKVPDKDTSVFTDDTNRSQVAAGSDSNVLEVRTCSVDANGNKTCPINTNETLVEDCKCDIGEQRAGFQTAITSLQVLNEASKDMICSSSSP